MPGGAVRTAYRRLRVASRRDAGIHLWPKRIREAFGLVCARARRVPRGDLARYEPCSAAAMQSCEPSWQLARASVSIAYPVVFTREVFSANNRTLAQVIARGSQSRHRVLFVVDAGLLEAMPSLHDAIPQYIAAHAEHLDLAAPVLAVVGGEPAKNEPDVLARVLRTLHDARIDRHSFVVAVGGGAVLDMVGYAAAITHRGVRLVRVPSTVLSQGDSAVGVKNGVNAFGKKNFFGAFAAPFAVVADLAFLDVLPRRERVSGAAEALKVALVRDPTFFSWIVRSGDAVANGDRDALAHLVERSAALHMEHIARCGDPFETGSARPLDFGHWAAHKLESLSAHRVRHGEGVGIGIALDTLYARSVGLCDDAFVDAVLSALRTLKLPLWDVALAERDARGTPEVLSGLEEFREHLGGELTITLVRKPGSAIDVNTMDRARVGSALDRLREVAQCA
jgi:3-dehydroquinate synthase